MVFPVFKLDCKKMLSGSGEDIGFGRAIRIFEAWR